LEQQCRYKQRIKKTLDSISKNTTYLYIYGTTKYLYIYGTTKYLYLRDYKNICISTGLQNIYISTGLQNICISTGQQKYLYIYGTTTYLHYAIMYRFDIQIAVNGNNTSRLSAQRNFKIDELILWREIYYLYILLMSIQLLTLYQTPNFKVQPINIWRLYWELLEIGLTRHIESLLYNNGWGFTNLQSVQLFLRWRITIIVMRKADLLLGR
jgi:hypothetical protein